MVGSGKHCIITGCKNLTRKGPICKAHYSKLTPEIRDALTEDVYSLHVIWNGRGAVRKAFRKALYQAMKCIEMGKTRYRKQHG